MTNPVKLLLTSDWHCGNLLGLTPHEYIQPSFALAPLMHEFYDWFCNAISSKYDYMIHAGDIVDGEGKKDSMFHLTTNINTQMDMALEITEKVNADKNIFVHGTPYHTANNLDYDEIIAEKCSGEIDYKQKIIIDSIRFNIAHHIGRSSVPSGGDVMLKNELIMNYLYDLLDHEDPCDYIIRGHTHQYRRVENDFGTVITLPSLQLGIAKYNLYARKMSGYYSVGFLEMDIYPEKKIDIVKKTFNYKLASRKYREV